MALTREEALHDLYDEEWLVADQRVAEALELPAWETPEQTRQQVNDAFGNNPNVRKYDPRKPSDRYLLAQTFQRRAFRTAKPTAQAAIHALAQLDSRTLAGIRRKYRGKGQLKAPGKRPARYAKADARNLELLSFVVERIIPFGHLQEQRLDRHGKDVRLLRGHRRTEAAVPRQALADEWNRLHPHDRMSSGDVLMGEFYYAAARPHLTSEFLSQLNREIEDEWASLEDMAHKVATFPERQSPEGKASLKEVSQLTQRAREQQESMDADGWNAWVKYETHRVRDSLTRQQLVGRLLWRVALAVAGLKDEGLTQALSRPLRYWFLDEARECEPTQGERLSFPPEVWSELMRERIHKRLVTRRILGASSLQQHAPEAQAAQSRPPTKAKPTPSDATPARKRTSARSSRASKATPRAKR